MKKEIHFKRALFQISILAAIMLVESSCNNEDRRTMDKEYNTVKFSTIEKAKDAQFLVNAAEINLEEVRLGQLAQKNSLVKEVRDLGIMMQEMHLKSLTGLAKLAKKKLIPLPTAPTDDAQETYRSLKSKSGIDFEIEYCDMMVGGHKDAIAVFERISSNQSSDDDIRQWATATLSDLHKHLDLAIACQRKCEKM